MKVTLPNLGDGVENSKVVRIFVKEGEQINENQDLIEIESDKAVVTIPSTEAGKVTKLNVKLGDVLNTGSDILTLESSNDSSDDGSTKANEDNNQNTQVSENPSIKDQPNIALQSTQSATNSNNGIILSHSSAIKAGYEPPASPSVRKIAKQLNIDLYRVQGSGHGGRIAIEDVANYITSLQNIVFGTKEKESSDNQINKKIASKSEFDDLPDFSQWGEIEEKPLPSLRKLISQSMSKAWNTVPHVTQFDNANLTKIFKLKTKYQNKYKTKGSRLTITSFILSAIVETLKAHELFNASIDLKREKIVFKKYINLSIAVATDDGLIVPIIKDAQKKSVKELSDNLLDIAKRSRERKIKPSELKGGTFTISNQGGIGGAHFTPIVFYPQVAIIGLGMSSKIPAIVDDKIEQVIQLPLCLSYDHRLIDGSHAAKFIVDLKENLENFDEKLVKI